MKQRRFKFTLKALFAIVTCCAIGFAITGAIWRTAAREERINRLLRDLDDAEFNQDDIERRLGPKSFDSMKANAKVAEVKERLKKEMDR